MHRLLIRPSIQASLVKDILAGNHFKPKNLSHLIGIHELGSPDWHQHRSKTITASEAFSFLSLQDIYQSYFDFYGFLKVPKELTRPFNSSKKVIQNKIDRLMNQSLNDSNKAMRWGTLLEPIARDYFAKHVAQSNIFVPGQLVHPSYPFLTCSLDGIIENSQSILEVKCPFRHISFEDQEDGISLDIPKLQYWVQAQIQLEITDLDHAFIVQCQFVTYADEKDMLNDTSSDRLLKGTMDVSGTFVPFEQYTQNSTANLSFIYLDYLVIYHVPRDPSWFKAALPHLKNAYLDLKQAAQLKGIVI